jgi:hypothetical protein
MVQMPGEKMLTLDECFGFCDLDPLLIDALARQQNIPGIVAMSLASTWLETERGVYQLHSAFLDEIGKTWERGDHQLSKRLDKAYSGFRSLYPMPRVIS